MIKYLLLFLLLFCDADCQTYSLNTVLSLVVLNNPELSAFSHDMRASDAKILQAGLIPNPAFDAETENINATKEIQNTFLLMQLIELGHKRKARVELAKTELDAVYLDYEIKKRELFVDTAQLFIEVIVNQEKIAFLQEDIKKLERFAPIIEKRLKAGKGSITEQANYQVFLKSADIDLRNLRNELRNAKYKLAAQWAEINNDSFEVHGSLDWLPALVSLEKLGKLLETHPQIMRYHVENSVREAKIAVEKSKAFPDVTVRGGPRYLNDVQKWVWVFGLYVPLPVNDRNQGRVWESYELWEKLEKEKEALWVKLLTELNSSYAALQASYDELHILKHSVLPAIQKASDFNYKGFHLGRFSYIELLETERSYRTSKLRYLESLGEYHKTLVKLEGLTGVGNIFIEECH